MRFTSTTRKLYAAGIVLALALAILRMYGLGVGDLARIARAKLAEAAADARAVTSKEYADRYSRRLREESDSIPLPAPVEGNDSVEVSREVVAERKRILKERAEYLERVGVGMVKGDTQSLKKQVEESARRAGGGY